MKKRAATSIVGEASLDRGPVQVRQMDKGYKAFELARYILESLL